MPISTEDLTKALRDGLLSFPVTDLDERGQFNEEAYRQRIEWFISYPISSVFVAGGTGEFFSLSMIEYRQIVRTAAKEINGRIPLIASTGRSIPQAIEFAQIAEKAGVNALLLMPPYLVGCPQNGLYEYAKTIMDNTRLPVIYYNRSNGILHADYVKKLADACPNFLGVKDGTGDMQEINDMIKTVGDRLVYIGGVPTAEIISEAYLSIGVNTYSSAVFNFVPDLAIHFYHCLRNGDQEKVNKILQDFYIPFVRLRSREKGYAVSLIKAGAELIGKGAGNVRAPLMMPTQEEIEELKSIIEKGVAFIS